jgi:hypothetical protein
VGSTVFTGTLPAAATALVAALVAGELEPPELVATTDTVSVLPTSPVTGTYVKPVAPPIAVPARFHW